MVRNAQIEDIESILEICEKNLISNKKTHSNSEISNQGFLITKYPHSFFADLINDPQNNILLIIEKNQQKLGYLSAFNFNIAPEKVRESLQENNQNLSPNFFDQKILYYRQIAKMPDAKGVGNTLVLAMIQKAKEQNYDYIFCHIVESPIRNIASINFHENLGFKRIGQQIDHEKNLTKGVYLIKI